MLFFNRPGGLMAHSRNVWGVLKKSGVYRLELLSLLPRYDLDSVGLLGVFGVGV
jgi:hypothetical protein